MQKVNLALINLKECDLIPNHHPVFLASYEVEYGTEVGQYIKNRFAGIPSKFPVYMLLNGGCNGVVLLEKVVNDLVDQRHMELIPEVACIKLDLKNLVKIQDLECGDVTPSKSDAWILSDCFSKEECVRRAKCTIDVSLLSKDNLKMLKVYKNYIPFYNKDACYDD